MERFWEELARCIKISSASNSMSLYQDFLLYFRFAFVKFANTVDAAEAFKSSQTAIIDGEKATVLYAFLPKTQQNQAKKAGDQSGPVQKTGQTNKSNSQPAKQATQVQPASKKQKTAAGSKPAAAVDADDDEVSAQ